MGAASSVGIDPTTLRKEYEAMAASAASDEELLEHMKTLIISQGKAGDNGERVEATAKTQKQQGDGRRGSALRPNSHEGRISCSSNKQVSPRRGSWNRRQSKEDGRPLSAPSEALVASKYPKGPRSPPGGKNENKPRKCRRRSYLAEKPTPVVGDGVPAGGAEPEAAKEGAEAQGDKVDSWESVSLQPACPLCHTAFSSEESRDDHIKTCTAHSDQAPESTPHQDAIPVSAVDSTTIYSGTKLFWRSRLSVELLMQQHQQVNAVQVLVFDSSTDRELGQLWVSSNNVVARLGEDALKTETKAAEKAFANLGVNATPENVAAEATKRAVVSFIIKRILVEDCTEEGGEPDGPKSYKVTLTQMASDDGVELAMDKPAEVNPAVNRATTRRASIQEVDTVVQHLKENLSNAQGSAQAAAVNLDCAQGAMEKGRRGSVEVARRASASGMTPRAP